MKKFHTSVEFSKALIIYNEIVIVSYMRLAKSFSCRTR